MQQFYVVAHFMVTGSSGRDPVSAVASRLPDVFGVAYFPRAAAEGAAVFAVDCDGYAEAGRMAAGAFDRALASVGGAGHLLAVRASSGPDWLDPQSLGLSCGICGPQHDDEDCLECSACADAIFDRFVDDLLGGAGVPVSDGGVLVPELVGA